MLKKYELLLRLVKYLFKKYLLLFTGRKNANYFNGSFSFAMGPSSLSFIFYIQQVGMA